VCDWLLSARADPRRHHCWQLSLIQLGETLGISLASTNRYLALFREENFADLKVGKLTIKRWVKLAECGQFDPRYLHLRREPF
jgi:hypothetical protein